ncbi:hypothetical protein GQ55_3G289800 [Panicum hallii var. hallii]|uniref:Uncharacterized protein n=1 Tax=Panicum hallii var. hallii TaxID=1504633 RepID=A0A2T7EEH4_9POAL|nr:hypothetical protein GQ55_3G289800 [Panicum hallii var. hallii]
MEASLDNGDGLVGLENQAVDRLRSFALSVGSTSAMEIEDDANSMLMDENGPDECVGDGYKTPERECNLPYCGSIYEPKCHPSLQPSLGMVFDSLEKGREFYKAYAHRVGFSVRTWTQHKDDDGSAKWKRLVCSRQGWRNEGKNVSEQGEKPKRKTKISMCGCEAMIGFKRRPDGKYEVARFIQSRMHQLVSPGKIHLLRSNREVSDELRTTLFSCHKALLGTSAAFRLLSVEMGGHENIGCTKQDLKNHVRDFRQAISHGDGQALIDILKEKQQLNPSFFFEYKLDKQNRLTHIFWADGTCRKNFSLFRDVVSFDSTFRSNRIDLVFTPFTGVNHHKSCVTFAVAFILNEKIVVHVGIPKFLEGNERGCT